MIESGGTALAVAAEPTLGRAGYWLMTRDGAVRDRRARRTPASTRRPGCASRWREAASSRRCSADGSADACRLGILLTAAVAIVLAVGFDLSSIASIGSAIALFVFTLVTAAHICGCGTRPARTPAMLVLGVASTVIVLVTFAFTTLVDEPATAVALVVILVLSIVIDSSGSGRETVASATARAAWSRRTRAESRRSDASCLFTGAKCGVPPISKNTAGRVPCG